MHKRMLAFCVAALMALAVVPAIASASPVLTENGTAVATGTSITAETDPSSPEFIFTGSNPAVNVVCTVVDMGGKVVKNSGTSIEGTIESASFKGSGGGACSGGSLGSVTVTIPALTNAGGSSHWCIKTGTKADTFEILPNACGTAGGTFTFTLHTGVGECNYTRTSALTGTYITNTVPATLTLGANQSFTRENNNIFCPSSGVLDGSLILPGFSIS